MNRRARGLVGLSLNMRRTICSCSEGLPGLGMLPLVSYASL